MTRKQQAALILLCIAAVLLLGVLVFSSSSGFSSWNAQRATQPRESISLIVEPSASVSQGVAP